MIVNCLMQTGFLVFFTLIWSAFILTFDGFIAQSLFKQFESRHYPAVVGKVSQSEVKSQRGSKGGITYQALITYQFEVGGQTFAGSRLRYIAGFDSGQAA